MEFGLFRSLTRVFTRDDQSIFLAEDGTVLTWNETFGKRRIIAADRAIGKNFNILYCSDITSTQTFEDLLRNASRKGSAKATLKASGSDQQVKVVVKRIRGIDKRVLGFSLEEY